MNDWISVEDQMPDKHGWYLVWRSKTYCAFTAYFDGAESVFNTRQEITHWMPLPDPPSDV
jgi:hypothetical protein